MTEASRNSASVIEVVFEPVMVSGPFYFTRGSEADDPHLVFTRDMYQNLGDFLILKWLLFN
jgi:hypothetical protein